MKFSFESTNVRKLASAPLYLVFLVVSLFVPRKKRLWIFGSKGAFGGNSRYLMEYVHDNLPNTTCIWMAHSLEEKEAVAGLGMRAEFANSLRGLWCSLRAGVGVVSFGLGDVNRLATAGMYIVQLWHGAPIKKIGLDTNANFKISLGPFSKLGEWLIKKGYSFSTSKYNLVCASSELTRQRFISAFGITADRAVATGEPKADVILAGDNGEAGRTWRARMRARYQVPQDGRIVLYAPTWRDSRTMPLFPEGEQLELLNTVLRARNAWMLFRAHNFDGQDGLAQRSADRVFSMTSAEFPDVNYLLSGVDLLVSDFSGILIEYSLLRRPIIFFAPDLAEYEAERGLYEDYRTLTGGRWAGGWSEVIANIDECLSGKEAAYLAGAKSISDRYIRYFDTDNCQRIAAEIAKRVGLP